VQNKLFTVLSTFLLVLLIEKPAIADPPPLSHKLSAIKSPFFMPPLHLEDMDKNIFDIKDIKKKVIVINFWASWCKPCRREMASLERLHQKTINRNVFVIAVNVGEDVEMVSSFLDSLETKPTFPIIFDHDTNTSINWAVKGLPTTYIIDANGLITYRAIGGRDFDHPELIRKILMLKTKSLNY